MAWAMDPIDRTVRSGSRLNRVLLIRLDAGKLSPETRSRAADGVVAYTAICTHTGCEVVEWLAGEGVLHCPCHFSKFNPSDGARVVDGPAPRPLPALPLAIVDGRLVVAKPFTTTSRVRDGVNQLRTCRPSACGRADLRVELRDPAKDESENNHEDSLRRRRSWRARARVDNSARLGASRTRHDRRFRQSCRTTSP